METFIYIPLKRKKWSAYIYGFDPRECMSINMSVDIMPGKSMSLWSSCLFGEHSLSTHLTQNQSIYRIQYSNLCFDIIDPVNSAVNMNYQHNCEHLHTHGFLIFTLMTQLPHNWCIRLCHNFMMAILSECFELIIIYMYCLFESYCHFRLTVKPMKPDVCDNLNHVEYTYQCPQ